MTFFSTFYHPGEKISTESLSVTSNLSLTLTPSAYNDPPFILMLGCKLPSHFHCYLLTCNCKECYKWH